MLLWPDCIPCTLKMILDVARLAMDDPDRVDRFFREVLALPAFAQGDWNRTSPELVGEIWGLLAAHSGVADPLAQVKERQNEAALTLYPAVRECVLNATDPFAQAVKVAIVGNAIDAMVGAESASAEQLVARLGGLHVDEAEIETLRARLGRARTLAYLVDNCGEIVFDRLLLEVIEAERDLEVTLVTHTVPILNDALLDHALAVGLDTVARVVENGTREPFPGNYVAGLAPAVRDLVCAADLVISKGVANYELLSEEGVLDGRVSYLLHGKCHPICSVHEVPRGGLVIRNQ